ncbi:uncharacterized protein LOC34621107 [Cyclospora cayetanensis]|uniref:Uncharacterized protein LOC34621107 n=1 Tax=Cyclospora cayetanensis TaxID=88456 RepID=A0A6P6RUK2_9EIME|nr:uncharacterized protein LOC34621107 [Cyclospora cayetanensis]
MNYPTWPPPNASPLHPLEPWGRQLFVFRPYAGDLSAAIKGPYPRIPPLRGPVPPFDQLSPHLERLATAAAEAVDAAEDAVAAASRSGTFSDAAYEAATAANRAAAAAATAAAAEVAAGPLLPAEAPVLCVADHGRRPLMFLSREDLGVLKEHMQQFKQLIEDFRQEATASNIEGIYAFRRRLLPYKTVGMQRMKKGEHQSYGMKKGVPREKKT